MSLRLRLFVAFLVIALVMAGLSLLAVRQSRRIQQRVTELTSISISRFEQGRSIGQALEIEGDWLDAGIFAVSEIQVLAQPRRPKLRGTLQEVDAAAGILRIYGVSIATDGATDMPRALAGGLADLSAGDRLEISCTVDSVGHWYARKIRTEGLKASDKIKGTVTAVVMDGVAPDTLEISGIMVRLDFTDRGPDPQTELKRISLATRMSLAAQDCALAAERILAGSKELVVALDGEPVDAATLLLESVEDLDESIGRAREAAAVVDPVGGGEGYPLGLDLTLWLDPLARATAELDAAAERFLSLHDADRDAAGVFLRKELEPLLVDRLRPLIQSYLLDAEERLAQEVEEISNQASATARALLGSSALALVFALSLGYGVWRSISLPLLRLKHAAEEIGRGRLDTQVEVSSRDELGLLADTINHMASDLAATTVSIANLDDILESMAAALFILSREGLVTSANKAAGALVGRPQHDLAGCALADLCVGIGDAAPLLPVDERTISGEAKLRAADGTETPVSFSAAALSSGEGPARGFVWIAQDLSQRKHMEEQLRRSLAEKELLLREVHHRVKNNLQVISSLLELQADSINDSEARAVYDDSQARIRSMALIHQQLYGTTNLDRIDFGMYLDQLASSLFQFHGGSPTDVTIRSEANRALLGIDQALTCGLIINELVTNALKHAFAPGQPGTVTVGFRSENGRHIMTVADDGVGLDSETAGGEGDSLGMSLVEALVEQLAGRMNVTNGGGTSFTIDFPAEEAIP